MGVNEMIHTSPVLVVAALLRDSRGRIFCARRGRGQSNAGFWEFPGGKIEPGETPEAALVREIREEFGCTIAVCGDVFTDTIHEYPHMRVRLVVMPCTLREGDPVPVEHDRVAWLLPRELSGLDWAPADLPAVRRLAGID